MMALPRTGKFLARFSTRSILAQAHQVGQKNPFTGEYVGTVDLDVRFRLLLHFIVTFSFVPFAA